jgi:hypothetical protein
MEHLLLCVALSTGIALVSLDLSSMQFPTVGFHRSRLAKQQWNRVFSKCFGFLLLVNIPPLHASIIQRLTSGHMRRHSFAQKCSEPMMMIAVQIIVGKNLAHCQ